MEYLEDSHYEVRLAAIRAIRSLLKEDPKQLASLLVHNLKEREPKVANEIIFLLEI